MVSGPVESKLRPFKFQAFVEPGDKCIGRESFVSRQIEEIVL